MDRSVEFLDTVYGSMVTVDTLGDNCDMYGKLVGWTNEWLILNIFDGHCSGDGHYMIPMFYVTGVWVHGEEDK